MDTTTSVVATGVVVSVGRWADEKEIAPKMFIGLGILAVFLAVFQAGNEKLAQQFGTLILVSAILIYGVPIGKAVGGIK